MLMHYKPEALTLTENDYAAQIATPILYILH